MQIIVYINIYISHNFVSVFHNQYNHGAKFHIEYNNDLHQKYKLAVSVHPGVIVFNCIYYW